MNIVQRLAGRAPVPVFVAAGANSDAVMDQIHAAPQVRPVVSPRHAHVLLVTGDIPADHTTYLQTIHDQLPHPRATLWCNTEPVFDFTSAQKGVSITPVTATQHDLNKIVVQIQYALLQRTRISEPDLLPDTPPHPWQGKGEHGQGGEGMMGGKPYGRPMAMMDADIRDGLMLDALTFTLGPFFNGLPAGLIAEVTLQGDLIQTWKTRSAPYPHKRHPLFAQPLEQATPITRIESARAEDHLRRLAKIMEMDELPDSASQARTLASLLAETSQPALIRHHVQKLERHLRRVGFFAATRNIGTLNATLAEKLGGYVARASGVAVDARAGNVIYEKLGFSIVCQTQGDVGARRRQLFSEINQSLMLAERAAENEAMISGNAIETPTGAQTSNKASINRSDVLTHLLPGMEWHAAMLTIGSLALPAEAFG